MTSAVIGGGARGLVAAHALGRAGADDRGPGINDPGAVGAEVQVW